MVGLFAISCPFETNIFQFVLYDLHHYIAEVIPTTGGQLAIIYKNPEAEGKVEFQGITVAFNNIIEISNLRGDDKHNHEGEIVTLLQ